MSIPAQGAVGADTMTAGRDHFPERRGDWMQTYTGRRFWPLDPRPEDVAIEDIAHALALQTRFGGHCLRFYSVAEHCVHLARSASPEAALWLLLHDGSEAYLSDMVRPLKRHMPEYRAVEDRVAWVVYEAFDLDPGMEPAEVKERDCRILIDERAQVMLATGETWNYGGATERLGVTLQFWTPEQAEREFLATFAAITGRSVTISALASPRADSDERTAGEDHPNVFRVLHALKGSLDSDVIRQSDGLLVGDLRVLANTATPAQPAGAVPDSLRATLKLFADEATAIEASYTTPLPDGKFVQISLGELRKARAALADLDTRPAGQSAGSGAGISVDVATMRASNGTDYYVRIACDGREVTPHCFKERWKAEYEAAHYAWIFGLRADEPCILAFDAESHPNAPNSTRTGDEGLIASEPCAWAGGNDTCYCRTCGEEYRYGREDKPACPKKPAPDSTRTGAAETELTERDIEAPIYEAFARYVGNADERASDFRMFATGYHAALAARPEAPSDAGWRDISTAPKDGTPILAYERSELDNQTPMHWFDVVQYRCPDKAPDGWYSAGDHRGPPSCSPSHWMILPTPPSDPAPSGQAEG